MRPTSRLRPIATCMMAVVLALGCRDRGPEGIALVGGTVLDGSGGAPLRDAVIIVRDGHVEAVAPRAGFDMPRRMQEVDISGKWVIPGLIDAHAHVEPWALDRYLAYGVTSVRNLHGPLDSILALRDRVRAGTELGPRIYSTGAMVDGTPPTYPDALGVDDAVSARKAVDSLVLRGVDGLKLYTRMDSTLLAAALDEARTFNLRVTAHLGLTDALTAAALGLRSIEHLTGVPEATRARAEIMAAHRRGFFAGWTAFAKSWSGIDSTELARVAAGLAERRVVLVPTLVVHEMLSRLGDPALYEEPALRAVPPAAIRSWDTPDMIRRAGWSQADFEAFARSRPAMDRFIRMFRAEGGIVAAGSDAVNQQLVPGESMHREMELLVRAGLAPEDALLAATRNVAALLGADSIGTIAAGRAADLVVLGADPMANISNTRRIEQVMVRGVLFPVDSLRAGW
ncbi:MAG TPA: amidohydrolase family protein [Gemmatimonadales bacterium]